MKKIFLISFFLFGVNITQAREVTKTVQAQFIGDLSSNNLVATDITPITQDCKALLQGDCFFLTEDGQKINGFALGGGDIRDVTALRGLPFSARFDTTPRRVELINELGTKTIVNFKVIGIGFQVNSSYQNAHWYTFENTFTHADGTTWPSGADENIVPEGDCKTLYTTGYVTAKAFRTFWLAKNTEGMANCYAKNAFWSTASNAIPNYQAIGPYFLYSITTEAVTGLEPGKYTSITPLRYTVGVGKQLDPFQGTFISLVPSIYVPVPDSVSININLTIEHSVKISGIENKIKLYPGTSVSWNKWFQIRTPLKNDVHFRMASTGPIRLSVLCKDATTSNGDCALLRRNPSGTIEPGTVDPTDTNKYGVELKINLAGFRNYYTKEPIQNYILKPSTSALGSKPTSSLTLEPLTTNSNPGSIDIKTLPGVAELMEAGRTYAGSITLVIEPGEI